MVLLATNNSYRSVGTYSTSICDHYETHKNIFLYIMYCLYFSGYGRYATAVESMNRCSFVCIIANVSEFILILSKVFITLGCLLCLIIIITKQSSQ